MAYLEELLPKFRKGTKIRCDYWDEGKYIKLKEDGYIYDDNDDRIEFSSLTIFGKSWQLYKENEPDWDYIIKHNCLCWFWDGSEEYKNLGYLIKINEHSELFHYGCIDGNGDYHLYTNCHPVERNEINFYDDKEAGE